MWRQLKVLDLKIILTALDDIKLPFFKENALRSALGTSLRATICATPLRGNCKGCNIESLCIYNKLLPRASGKALNSSAQIQEDVALPQESASLNSGGENLSPLYLAFFDPNTPMRIGAGESFTFYLHLFGPAVAYFPYFYFCLENMGLRGLGLKGDNSKRGKFEVRTIKVISPRGGETLIYSREEGAPPTGWRPFSLGDYVDGVEVSALKITTLSPLRLKYKNRLTSSVELHVLLRAALRRISDLYIKTTGERLDIDYSGLINQACTIAESNKPEGQWRWVDYKRYSTTQQRSMKLGGVFGDILYRGELTELYPYLKAGEVLAVGKGIAFGFGRYKVTIER